MYERDDQASVNFEERVQFFDKHWLALSVHNFIAIYAKYNIIKQNPTKIKLNNFACALFTFIYI